MDVNGAKALKERLGLKGANEASSASVDVPEDAAPVYRWLGVGKAAADAPPAPGRAVSESARVHKRSLPLVRVRTEDGRIVCERCEIADRALARMRGLLGRDALAPGSGMLIDPAPSVHMFFMRFPIDVVFLDRNRKVVRIVHRLRPWRVAGARKAVAALELPVGAVAEAGLEAGDALVLEDRGA